MFIAIYVVGFIAFLYLFARAWLAPCTCPDAKEQLEADVDAAINKAIKFRESSWASNQP